MNPGAKFEAAAYLQHITIVRLVETLEQIGRQKREEALPKSLLGRRTLHEALSELDRGAGNPGLFRLRRSNGVN